MDNWFVIRNSGRLVQNLPFLCYNFNNFKREKIISMNENKNNINWLACNMPTHFILIKRGELNEIPDTNFTNGEADIKKRNL